MAEVVWSSLGREAAIGTMMKQDDDRSQLALSIEGIHIPKIVLRGEISSLNRIYEGRCKAISGDKQEARSSQEI